MIVGMFRFRKVCFFALLLIVYFNSNVCYGMEEVPVVNKNEETAEGEYDTKTDNQQPIVNNQNDLSFNIVSNVDYPGQGEFNNIQQGSSPLDFANNVDHNLVPGMNPYLGQSNNNNINQNESNFLDFNNNSGNNLLDSGINLGLGQSNNNDQDQSKNRLFDPNAGNQSFYNQDLNIDLGNQLGLGQDLNMMKPSSQVFNQQSTSMKFVNEGTVLQNPLFNFNSNLGSPSGDNILAGNQKGSESQNIINSQNNLNSQNIINSQNNLNSQNDPNFQSDPKFQNGPDFQDNSNLNSTPIGEGFNSQGQESMSIYRISKNIDNIDNSQNNINNARNQTEMLDASSSARPINDSGFNNIKNINNNINSNSINNINKNINNNINSNSINNINKDINNDTRHNKFRAPGRIKLDTSTGGGESPMPEPNNDLLGKIVSDRCMPISSSLYNNTLDCVTISEVLEDYDAALKEKWEEIGALKQIVVNLEELGLAQAEGGEGVDDNKANDNIKKGNVLNDGKKELVTSQQQETNNAIVNEDKNQLVDSSAVRPQGNLIDNKSVVLGKGQNDNPNLNDDENSGKSVLSGGNPEEVLPAEDIFFDEDVSSLKNVTMEKMKLETDFYEGHVANDLYGGIRCFSDERFYGSYLDSFHGLTEQEVKLFENISEKGKADVLRRSCLTRIDNLKKEINDLECRNLVFRNMLGLNENIRDGLLPEIQKSLGYYWFFYDRFRRNSFSNMYDPSKFNVYKSSGNRFFSFFRSIPNADNDITGVILDFLSVECQAPKRSLWTVLDELASFCKKNDVALRMSEDGKVILCGDNNEILIVDSSLFKVVSEHVSSLAFAKDLTICLNNIKLYHLKERVRAIASAFGDSPQQVKFGNDSNPVPCRVVYDLNSLKKEVPHFLVKCIHVNSGRRKLTVIEEKVFKQLMTDFIVDNVGCGNVDGSILPLLQNIEDVNEFCLKEFCDAIDRRMIKIKNRNLDGEDDLLDLLKKFTADKKIDIKDLVEGIDAGLLKLKEKVDTFHGHAASDLQKEISFMSKDSMYRNKISEYKNAIEGLYLSKRPFYFVAYRVFKPIASFVWSFVNSIKKYEDVSEVNKLYFFAPFFCVGYRYKSSSMPFWLDHIDVNFNFLGGVFDVASYVLFRHFSLKHFYYGVSNCAMMDYSYADFLCYAFFSFFNVNINIKCSDFFFSLNLVGILRAIILPIIDMCTRKTSALNPVFVRVNKAYEAIQSDYNMRNELVEKYRGMKREDCADIFHGRFGELLKYCPLVPYSHPGEENRLPSALADLLLNLQGLSS